MTQHGWAVACFCLGVVAELIGGYGVVTAAFAVRAVQHKPSVLDNGDGTFSLSTDQVDALVKAQALPWWSMAALGLGIVVGFIGNLLSL